MSIAFLVPSSGSFYKKILNVSSFDEKVHLCIENVDKFSHIIKKFHRLCGCPLKCCVIGLFSDNLQNYVQRRGRKSPLLLKKIFIAFCEKYPRGFKNSFKIVKSYQIILW